MTYNQRIINDRPSEFYPLEQGASAFLNHIDGIPAEVNGTPVPSPPLVVGGGSAYVFTGNDNFRFLSNLFYENSVRVPFTLEAWFKPVDVKGPKGIVGHYLQEDGICFDGERVYFSTHHGSAGNAVASYYPASLTGTIHAVGVHTGSKNELYVNGIRVAAVDLTTEQVNTPYQINGAPGYLYVGSLPGSVIIDAVAVYNQALTSRQAKLHFLWGRDAPDYRSVVTSQEGNYWTFSDETSDVALDFSFDTEEEWISGQTTSTATVNGVLRPSFDENNVTVAGSWQAGFILGAIGERFDGSKISWDSDGPVQIHTSINDGATWLKATNGHEVTGIGQNFTSGSQSLMVRVSFPAGESVDTITSVRSLSIKLYDSRNVQGSTSGATAQFQGNFALADRVYQPIEHEDSAGVHLYRSNVSLPSSDVRTIEMWVNIDHIPTVERYIFDARTATNAYLRFSGVQWSSPTGTTIYIDGEEKAGAAIEIVPGRWTHIVATFPATSGPVVVGDRGLPLRLGMYANYNRTLKAAEVASLYRSYLGVRSTRIEELTDLRMVDRSGQNIKAYTHSWSLAASG